MTLYIEAAKDRDKETIDLKTKKRNLLFCLCKIKSKEEKKERFSLKWSHSLLSAAQAKCESAMIIL